MSHNHQALTEKEKQTLRLIVRGYDAKSLARQVGIPVHTVNERLRRARRKMEVSSSREAARRLFDQETADPDFLVTEPLAEAFASTDMKHERMPDHGLKAKMHFAWIIGGTLIMSIVVATALLLTIQVTTPSATPTSETASEADSPEAALAEVIEQSTRHWLSLVDGEQWKESWNETGQAFKDLNTEETWANLSEQVRPPLGKVESRSTISQEFVPEPPDGYVLIKFRTNFAAKPDATETLTLVKEGLGWRVVGYWIT